MQSVTATVRAREVKSGQQSLEGGILFARSKGTGRVWPALAQAKPSRTGSLEECRVSLPLARLAMAREATFLSGELTCCWYRDLHADSGPWLCPGQPALPLGGAKAGGGET